MGIMLQLQEKGQTGQLLRNIYKDKVDIGKN